MPAQSYLAKVPGSVSFCTTEASLDTYRYDIEAKFSSGNASGDTLSHGDYFGKASLQRELSSVQKTLEKQPKPVIRSVSSFSDSAEGKQSKLGVSK